VAVVGGAGAVGNGVCGWQFGRASRHCLWVRTRDAGQRRQSSGRPRVRVAARLSCVGAKA
jgi:hypothetical protein